MQCSDSLSEKYARRAKDRSLSKEEKEAAELIVTCEKLLDEENGDEALELARKATALFKGAKDKGGIADSVRIQSQVMVHQGTRKEAAQLVKENLAMMKDAGDELGQAKMLLAMAEINSDCRGSAKRDEGLEQATEALELFRRLGDKKLEANTLLTLCSIHLKRRPDKMAGAVEAVTCASEALKLARSIGDKHGEASALHAYAASNVQVALLDPGCCLSTLFFDPTFEDGFNAAREALRIWEEIGNKSQESYELQCLAQWQLVAGRPEEALPDAERSAQIDCKGHKLTSIGMHVQALLANQQLDRALEIAEETLARSKEDGDASAELAALDMLVNTHSQNGQLKEAFEAAEEALEILRDKDDVINEMRMQGTIAQLQLDRQETVAATEAAEEMLRIAEELEDNRAEAKARHMIAEVMKIKGDVKGLLKEAKSQQKLYRNVKDVKGEALAMLEEADARYQKADFEEALETATKAQETYKDAGDKAGEASALGMIAEVSQMLNDSEAVLKASARQRSLFKTIGDKRGEAAAALQTCHARLYVLATSGHARGSQQHQEVWSRAYKEAKDGMTLAYTYGEDSLYAQSFYLLAQVYVAGKDKGEEALQCGSQAVEMYKEMGDVRGEAQAQVTVAHACHLLAKKNEAIQAVTAALALFQEIGDENGSAMAMQAMQQFVGMIPMASPGQFGQWDQTAAPKQEASGAPAPVAAGAAPAKAKLDVETVALGIKEAVSAITMMDVDADEPLMQAGLTSNTTVLLRNELTQLFPHKHLPFTLVFDFPDINGIANFLME
jgi:tetratricopeptide (TPR) repeat protein